MSIPADRKAARKAKARADRALCPVAVSAKLGLRVAEVTAAMRAHHVVAPLDAATAQRWLTGIESVPDWFAELLTRTGMRSAHRHARDESRRMEEEHTELLRSERVYRVLEAGNRRRFTEAEMCTVRDVAFRAAKDLVRGAATAELSNSERSALRVIGVDPGRHATWPLHTAGCDGDGGSCHQRAAELAAQRFERGEADRHARRAFTAAATVAIAAGSLAVGDHVRLYGGSRAGRVAAINRSTVAVRIVGTPSEGYSPVDKRVYPQHLTVVPDRAVSIRVGGCVRFRDWGGRVRDGVVTEVDGPLFRADYSLASGAPRSMWFDDLRLTPGCPS